jgi:hypothetical protein
MRKLDIILTDLDAAGMFYRSLELRLAEFELQVDQARGALHRQARIVSTLTAERDLAEEEEAREVH